jgi:hypothetical protein
MRIKYLIFFFLLINSFSCGYNILTDEEIKKNNEIKKEVEESISSWIIKYALYPKSYQSISFEEFTTSIEQNKEGKITNSEVYVMKHTHKILDKDSIIKEFSGYFILNNGFKITSIENVRSNSNGGGSTLDWNVWLSKFGKTLNHEDSVEFKNYEKSQIKKLFKDLKSGLENGDSYIEGEDVEGVKNIIDSISNLK